MQREKEFRRVGAATRSIGVWMIGGMLVDGRSCLTVRGLNERSYDARDLERRRLGIMLLNRAVHLTCHDEHRTRSGKALSNAHGDIRDR